MTVVATALRAERAKRVKFGVAVPPETNEPTTMPIAVSSGSPVDWAKTASRPPPSRVAASIEYVPSTAMSGTDTKLTTSIARMP